MPVLTNVIHLSCRKVSNTGKQKKVVQWTIHTPYTFNKCQYCHTCLIFFSFCLYTWVKYKTYIQFFLSLQYIPLKNGGWWFSLQVMSNSCDPMDCSPPGSSVRGILQARILEWVAIPFSRGPPWSRDGTCISYIAGGLLTAGGFSTAEPPGKPIKEYYTQKLP